MGTKFRARLQLLLCIFFLAGAAGCSGGDGGLSSEAGQTVEFGGETYQVGDRITYNGDVGEYCGSVASDGTPDYPSYSHFAVMMESPKYSEAEQDCAKVLAWFETFVRSDQAARIQIFNDVSVDTKTAPEGESSGYSFFWVSSRTSSPYSGVKGFALGY